MSPDDLTEKIELLVNDENRIVTYKILSYELGVHVNKAKQYMMDFVNAQKSKGINLEVFYFLAGFVEKDGLRTVKVLVVAEDNLEKAKKSFTELTSLHIYSIYKGISKDECALYSTDFSYIKDRREQSKYSAIKHPGIEIQPPVLNKMPTTKDSRVNFYKKESCVPANGSLPSTGLKTDTNKKVADDSNSSEKTSEENQAKDVKGNKSNADVKKAKSGTLMSMWQKKEDKSNASKKENSKSEIKGKEAAKNISKGNILSMFSKQAEKNASKPQEFKPVSKEVEDSKIMSEVTKKESPKNVQVNESKKPYQKRKVSDKHSTASSKSKSNNSDSEGDFKSKPRKHRRICTFDDSDSDSAPEEEKEKERRSFFLSEEPVEPVVATEITPMSDDSEEPIPPTPPVVKGKGKVWKTVQKTYEDEDGFFVTKKEKELVSASEDEEDPLKEKPVKNEVVDKINQNVNKKQASLMSFFKQK